MNNELIDFKIPLFDDSTRIPASIPLVKVPIKLLFGSDKMINRLISFDFLLVFKVHP